jgi:hypothetical protein
MKKILVILLVLVGVVLVARFVLGDGEDDWICTDEGWAKHGNPTEAMPTEGCEVEQLIGGDVDEGGCLIGAGYSWCEAKGKCLRVWEEECE